MSAIPLKTYAPTPRMIACMAKMKAAIDPQLEPMEMLALVSQLVGNLIALQDQRRITPEMAMIVVSQNIEVGNQEAIREVASIGGEAN